MLGHEETYLWPGLLADGLGGEPKAVGGIWPTRTVISSETWHSLFDQAERQIDILIYAGAFLIETIDLIDVLRFKAEHGTTIRLLVGDPDSAAVKSRADELGLAWLPERCRTTATYLAADLGPNVCVRTHGTTLYASEFRFDDTLLINTHAHGVWASQSPVLRLDCPTRPVFQFYTDAFDRVWCDKSSRPRNGPGVGYQGQPMPDRLRGEAVSRGRHCSAFARGRRVE
jgi:hypothetical protein